MDSERKEVKESSNQGRGVETLVSNPKYLDLFGLEFLYAYLLMIHLWLRQSAIMMRGEDCVEQMKGNS